VNNPTSRLSPEDIRGELLRLRQGPALGHPGAVTALSDPLKALLLARTPPLSNANTASETTRLVAALRRAVDALSPHERRHAAVDFNLLGEHSWPSLTERQESLARVLGCSVKTVRRHAGQALDTLSLLLADGSYVTEPPPPGGDAPTTTPPDGTQRFLGVTDAARVDVICSALPSGVRPGQRPGDPLHARYGGFADLDALVYVRVRLAQSFPTAAIRDFHPGEYYNADPDSLIVLGAPDRNATYAELGPHLPYRFAPPPEPAIVFPGHGDVRLAPRWAPEGELLADLTVITRLTLDQGTTVVLLGGCLTLGVLGAAKCLLNGERGRRNASYLADAAGPGDVVAVTTTRKVGGITDTPDLTTTPPLLLLTRDSARDRFVPLLDNTTRYVGR
jgi:hypothetical protein